MSYVKSGMAKISRLGIILRVYVYEIDGLLIDTGPYSALNQLKPFFNDIKISQIALTHIHEDHTGNVNWLQKQREIPTYIHQHSINLTKENGMYPFYRRLFWGPRKPFNATPLPKEIITENYTFEVIETPGHSIDSVSFYERNNGWLFTGDLYITQKPKLFLKDESIPQTIKSLEKLIELDIDKLYCSHTGKINNGKEKLQGKLDYLLELQDNILTLHQKGLTKKEIEKKIFPKSSPLIMVSRNEFSYGRAVDSILNND